MSKQRVWDLPTRSFHWSLVIVVGLAWWTAETRLNDLHLWLGYGVLFLLLFRIGWGFFGSSTARFRTFVRGPASMRRYIRDRFHWPAAGHAPLGAISVVALLALLIAVVATGLFTMPEDGPFRGPLVHTVSSSASKVAYSLHEQSFNILAAVIALHITAIVLYRVLLGRDLLSPMITGKADLKPGVEPMQPGTTSAAIICAAIAIAITAWIIAGAPLP